MKILLIALLTVLSFTGFAQRISLNLDTAYVKVDFKTTVNFLLNKGFEIQEIDKDFQIFISKVKYNADSLYLIQYKVKTNNKTTMITGNIFVQASDTYSKFELVISNDELKSIKKELLKIKKP